MHAELDYKMQLPYDELDPSPDDVLKRFRTTCAAEGSATLSSHVAASIRLGQELRHVSGSLKQRYRLDESNTAMGYVSSQNFASLHFFLGGEAHLGNLKLTLPTLQVHQQGSGSVLDPPSVKVRLHARKRADSSESQTKTNEPITPMDEIRRLAYMSATVVQRVWKDLAVDTYQTFAQGMAEALFRVVDFEDPSLILCGIHVSILNPKTSASDKTFHAQVFETTAREGQSGQQAKRIDRMALKHHTAVESDRSVSVPNSEVTLAIGNEARPAHEATRKRHRQDGIGMEVVATEEKNVILLRDDHKP